MVYNEEHPGPTTFTMLGTDVMVNMLGFLKPYDIISLRRTCKALSRVTKLRTVWMNALRSIMSRHSITEATFPLQDMSLQLLEHVALSPHRFAAAIAKAEGTCIESTSTRVLTTRLTNDEKRKYGVRESGYVEDILLAPGGRYLATLSMFLPSNVALLTVWDLGLSGHDVIKPIIRFLEQTKTLNLYLFFPDPRSRDVFYIISRIDSSQRPSFFAYKVSMGALAITFIARLDLPPPQAVENVQLVPGSCLTLFSSSSRKDFWVWNFLDNTAAAFVGPACSNADRIMQLFPYPDCILLASKDKILIYNIPPLRPFDSIETAVKQKVTLVVSMPSSSSDAFYIHYYAVFEPNDHILKVDSGQVTVVKVKDANLSRDPEIPNKIPVVKGTLDIRNAEAQTAMRLSDLYKGEDCFYLRSEWNAGKVSILDLEQFFNVQDGGDLKLVQGILNREVDVDICISAFSPILGRECILTSDNVTFIFDYLVPPE